MTMRRGCCQAAEWTGSRPPCVADGGGESPVYIAAINTALARRIAQAERLIVPGAGHMLPITHPQAVAKAVRAFLQRVPTHVARWDLIFIGKKKARQPRARN
jgi:hypothetical protein